MKLTVTALVEDSPAPGAAVQAEHGLALLIEAGGCRVLFDAGASGLMARNADTLRCSEALADLDAVVLSHGHYDHTGGLTDVLRRSPCALDVLVGSGFFARKVHRSATGLRDIGVPATRMEFEGLNARFVEAPGPTEILPGFFVTGEIATAKKSESSQADLCIEDREGNVSPDQFLDERALAVRTERGIVVFVGCAHRGLANSIAAAQEATGEQRVRAIFGGAHLYAASADRIGRTVANIVRLGPGLVALGHCTGREAERRFGDVLDERFEPLRAGARWTLE